MSRIREGQLFKKLGMTKRKERWIEEERIQATFLQEQSQAVISTRETSTK
jgi:hypothetical protein